jgi:hypothetical protein
MIIYCINSYIAVFIYKTPFSVDVYTSQTIVIFVYTFGNAAYLPPMPVGTQSNASPAPIASGASNADFGMDIIYE